MTDRRTDRRTDGIAVAYTRYSYGVARKNDDDDDVVRKDRTENKLR